jgi:hypothetical protein
VHEESINDNPIPSGSVRLKCIYHKPRYGWNVFRWLFGRPKYWELEYTFEQFPNLCVYHTLTALHDKIRDAQCRESS